VPTNPPKIIKKRRGIEKDSNMAYKVRPRVYLKTPRKHKFRIMGQSVQA
jgi:hypothetical protein